MGVDSVAAESNFFGDLGADLLVMAQLCALLRKRPDMPTVSMRDVYRNPTIRGLATAFAEAAPAAVVEDAPTVFIPAAEPARKPYRASTLKYLFCGAMQLLVFLAYSYLAGLILDTGYDWVIAGTGWADIYLRALQFGGLAFIGLSLLPIVVKWALIGRFKPEEIPIWSMRYLRFWIVKTLIRANPLLLLIGARARTSTASPLLNLYLRALGAKIGRNVAIFSRTLPVCADLLTIGEGTVIRKDATISGYRAQGGVIEPGRSVLGKNVFVGEMATIDIHTSMGDDAPCPPARAGTGRRRSGAG